MVDRFTVGAAAFLLIQGCAVGPDYVEPEAELQAAFVEAAEGPYTADPIPATLWESFGDPDLEALIERALVANTTIAQSLATLNETRALSGLTLYSWFPTVGTSVDATRNQPSSRDPFIPPGVSATDLYRAGFDMSWEIDLFGRLRGLNRGIRQRVEANTAALRASQLSIVAEVAQAYFSLRGAQQRLIVQQRNLDNLGDNVRILEASLEAGRGTALDVARVKSLERSLAAQLPQTRAAIARAEQRLGVLTAQGVDDLRSQLMPQRELPAVPDMVPVGTPEEWLRRRPDVQAAERRLAEAVSNVGVEMSAYYPRLDLLGTFGWTGNGTGDIGSGEAERWTFGPAISWRILDFGRIRQNVLAAEARADRAFAVFELAGYRAASLTAEALAEAVAQSETASNLARLRFDNGVGTYLAVLDAERTQLDLEDQYAVAVTDRTTALAALYKALGGDFAAPGGP